MPIIDGGSLHQIPSLQLKNHQLDDRLPLKKLVEDHADLREKVWRVSFELGAFVGARGVCKSWRKEFNELPTQVTIDNRIDHEKIDIFKQLMAFPNVKRANLAHCVLESLSGLGSLEQLTHLDLNSITFDLIPSPYLHNLAGLTKLIALDLSGCTHCSEDELCFFSRMVQLQKLKIVNTRPLDDTAPLNVEHIAKLTNLEFLDVSFRQLIHFQALENLTKISHLNLRFFGQQSPQEDNLKDLSQLTNLVELNVNHRCLVEHASINHILGNRKIQRLDIGLINGRPVGEGLIVRNLTALRELKELNVSFLTLLDVRAIRELQGLTKLDLTCIQYDTSIDLIRTILYLPHLIDLNVEKCISLNDLNILQLTCMGTLKKINTQNCIRFSVEGHALLRSVRPDLEQVGTRVPNGQD